MRVQNTHRGCFRAAKSLATRVRALLDGAGREVARIPFALVEEAFDDLDDEEDGRDSG